jgi:nucleoside-diphosphate-sugar epimerase
MTVPRLVIVGASGVIGGALRRAARAAGQKTVGTGLSRQQDGLLTYDMRSVPLRSVVPDLGSDDVVVLLAGYI